MALTLLLLRVHGPPQHAAAKAAATIVIVAGFGAFAGVLIEAARHGDRKKQ